MRRGLLAGLVAPTLALGALASVAPAASAATSGTFDNPASITIRDNNTGDPYPSTIAVSGLTAPITDVNVTLRGFAHDYVSDVGIVLQAPNGDSIVLMNAVSGSASVSGVTVTFDDQASVPAPLLRPLANGSTVRPASYDATTFTAPAPSSGASAPTGTTTLASAFGGDDANGTWKLFVEDFYAGDAGVITGGWSLSFNQVTAPTVTGTNPASPGTSTTPAVTGTAPAGSTVKLYPNATCSGTPVATGTAAAFASPGLAASVAAGSTTTFYATATDAGGNVSACSTTSATYVQRSVTPPPPPPVAPDTTLTSVPKKVVKTTKRKVAVSFGFTATVPGATFACTLDGKALGACTSGLSVKVKAGKHTFSVAATANGLTDATPAAYDFKVKRKKRR